MKLYIKSSKSIPDYIIFPNKIISVTLSDDYEYSSSSERIYGSKNIIDYRSLTREELLSLPKKELEKISDIDILRKLDYDDLTIQQKRDVSLANQEKFTDNSSKVKQILSELRNCHSFHINDSEKNDTFFDEIYNRGGIITDEDARNIIYQLHVKDYSESTYSYLRKNWCSLLYIFDFNKPYEFKSNNPESDNKILVPDMDVYIKIDVDNKTRNGYAVMSLHRPEYKMNHPYKNYPEDKE